MLNESSIWSPATDVGSADDAVFAAFTDEFGVQFPEAFKELYRIQNGGYLRDVEWPEYLLPLSKAGPVYERVCSLQQWAEAGAMVTADELDWVEEEYGDANLVFLLSSDGHTSFALNYNQCDAGSEPVVV